MALKVANVVPRSGTLLNTMGAPAAIQTLDFCD